MNKIIFHIDVNSAFLSWSAVEKLKNGGELDLRTIPCIIGGDQSSRRGVVLAQSIPAKQYGIRTGEPVADAFRKCPILTMEKPNHKLYQQYSRTMMDYLKGITPEIEQLSVDECFLDYTGIQHIYGEPLEGARMIKEEIHSQFGFTVNIGISNNKLLAKMASDFQKPNKIHTLFPSEIQEKMWPLHVGELYMAGKAAVKTLENLEVKTIGDLAKIEKEILKLHLKSQGEMLWSYANGMDEREVESESYQLKGIGNSTTLPQDAVTLEEAKKVLLWLAESVGGRLRKAKQKANVLNVEIKYNTFRSVSHQCRLQRATNSTEVIYQVSGKLFVELWDGEPIRLLGIRSAKLEDENEPEQMSLFDLGIKDVEKNISEDKQRKLDAALDDIRNKYGDKAVSRGTLMKKE